MKWKSEEAIKKHLKNNWDKYNLFDTVSEQVVQCPLTTNYCKTWRCASWKNAKVDQANSPLDADKVEWKIIKGYCLNPLVCGSITIEKE